MSDDLPRQLDADAGVATSAPAAALDGGTYEVLRARLREQSGELARRCTQLNDRRIAEFGGIEMTLLGTERIRTEHNCVPRDIVALPDGRMVFGYNVFIGSKPHTEVGDVFAVHRFRRDGTWFGFEEVDPAGLFDDARFHRDFAELYRYYSQTRLLQLRRTEGRMLAVFQTGQRTDDIKVLRWRTENPDSVRYLDNRGERDHVFPAAHEFTWTETTRADQVPGRHPHLSILNEVFVETLGGTLTIKVENDTETGSGIYSEPVAEPLQSLADADVHYARVGVLILLRIRPYNEINWRYLVFNTRTRGVLRLDGIGLSCRLLPDEQGIIFPGGYYLDTGVHKTFDTAVTDLEYERTVRAASGEDVLYVFHARAEGRTLLLPYNVIAKRVSTPITCHGYSLFNDGTMVVFRALSDEPARVHPMQLWQTPFVSDVHAARQPVGAGALARIGNAELVRGISECLSVARMADDMAPATAVFEAMIAACVRVADHYPWLADPDLGAVAGPLAALRATAEQVLDEFEKVTARTEQAAAAVAAAADQIADLVRTVDTAAHTTAEGWVGQLTELHRAHGRLATLRELRYVDTTRLDELTATVSAALVGAGHRAIEALSDAKAFDELQREIAAETERAETIATSAEAEPIRRWLTERADALRTVIDVVSGLRIADATVRTGILESLGTALAGINRVRATLQARRADLATVEGRAEFAAEFALFGQAVTGALAISDTPDACDDQVAKLLLTVENLEARFGELDDFAVRLAAEREDIHEAFAARKQALVDERSQRAGRLTESAQRLLRSIERRCATLTSTDEVNAYFAADPMPARLREVVAELRAIDEVVRAEEFDGRVSTVRQEAVRALRDRQDLYTDGGETIRLGRHRFTVDSQPMDVALVPHADSVVYSITGTDYRAPVRDSDFADTAPFWSQLLVSETEQLYRSEYLATTLLAEAEADGSLESLHAAADDGELPALVRRAAEHRYDEGYQLGVHDHDATVILSALLRLRAGAGLLRYRPADRAAAQLWWRFGGVDWGAHDTATRTRWTTRITSMATARTLFANAAALTRVRADLAAAIAEFAGRLELADVDPQQAGAYLFEELATAPPGFVTARAARILLDRFHRHLAGAHATARVDYERDLLASDADLPLRFQLVTTWLTAFDDHAGNDAETTTHLPEAVAIELCGSEVIRHESAAELTATVPGLLGDHPRITHRTMSFRIDDLTARAYSFRTERVPGFRAYLRRRNELVTEERHRLRLHEYRPTVPSGFVRNRLIDEVYLPLIGDNLGKQLGVTGDGERVDQSGLLLLISPPGYGKTSLIEYVAARLGMIFVKVNGPSLGHAVRSVDPAAAPNATARQEVEKINFALELGNNVLLYLDDIQHTSPELLQKFITLCDGQRRMEGVWDGRSRTYDLRGKRFAVCMSGNPYTEQGTRFRIPDMLANRADVWNLGDVLSGREDLFALSYLENALTANPVLAPLSARDRGDLELLLRIARGDDTARTDQLIYPYTPTELSDITSVLRKMLRVQEVVLDANRAYIASAATADAARTKPPFRLQGSYRDMNALAARIVPVMNDDELEALIDDHYTGEAQALAADAEANLLQLAELRGRSSPAQATRWDEVKAAYLRERALGGDADDPMVRAVGGLGLLADRIGAIEAAIRAFAAGASTGPHTAQSNSRHNGR
ncbi:ATPase family associated with various cellular activities (AAA) [Nocardia amikacinitolerans]|uniref:DNA repair ATPase n=1 Tax=Nocardia amikacinitolerans TaxID=756689 RepID=UPI0008362FAB|nr:DNA repair ATPase [Nocardia amikacinitolerans]MCP2319805.1 ATPase family associated with various cellular activities (AAA) [Nocardia amikacinitolerans]